MRKMSLKLILVLRIRSNFFLSEPTPFNANVTVFYVTPINDSKTEVWWTFEILLFTSLPQKGIVNFFG